VGLAVIGAALGGAAFYYGDRALSAADATTRLEHDGGAWTQAAADRERDGVRSQTYAIVFGTAALVAAAAAVWLLVTGPAHRGVN
jgi:hypothetical protein